MGNNEFIREFRYLVFKIKDINKYLCREEKEQLLTIVNRINAYRINENKKPFECVVVEDDWPEYETVWGMIEKRMVEEEDG